MHTYIIGVVLSLFVFFVEFDVEIMREMGQLGILGPTIKGRIDMVFIWARSDLLELLNKIILPGPSESYVLSLVHTGM